MTKEKIIQVENISFEIPGNTVIYTVPLGMSFVIKGLTFKTNLPASLNGDGQLNIIRKSDNALIYTGTSSNIISSVVPGSIEIDFSQTQLPIITTQDNIELQITNSETGDDVFFDIEITGTLSGDILVEVNGKNYTDIASIEAYLGVTITAVDEYNGYIQAMSRYMDKYCNRVLFDDEVKTLKYDGDGSSLLHILDCCEISQVLVDDISMEFYKYPKNKPYASRIALDGYRFSRGLENVSVTGIHAMSAILTSDISLACTVLVAGIHNAKSSQGKIGTTERINNYSITYKDEAQRIDFETSKTVLAGYKRIAL